MNAPDVREMRKNWQESITEYDAEQLVFLDESGVNIDMSRIYGRAMGGRRTVDRVPLGTPKSTTILSSIRLNGETTYTTYSGGTKREQFTDYLKNTLIPTLHEGDIVIMDNMRTHHVSEVRTILEDAGMTLLYLPPYSPDFNPIEKTWSKIKAVLRKLKVRDILQSPNGIQQAFACVTPSDCLGWFRSVGLSC